MKLTASDRSSLIRIASELPVGSEPRKAILAGLQKAAAVKAEEPYKEVEGHPYTLRGGKPDTIKGVTNEKQLRDLSKLLDEAYGKMTPALEKKLSRYGVSPRGIEDLASGGGGYMLYLTDATGEEYDVSNDLGI